jgi:hypothetical protein
MFVFDVFLILLMKVISKWLEPVTIVHNEVTPSSVGGFYRGLKKLGHISSDAAARERFVYMPYVLPDPQESWHW